MDLLDLLVKIGVDDQATGAIEGISTRAVALGNVISNVFSAAMSAVSNSVGAAVSRVDTMNSFSIVMENMGISSEAAQTSIDTLSDKLTGLPTALDTAVSGVKRFTSVSGDVGQATEYFLAMNNAIIAGQAPTEQQASAVEQLSQAYSKGKFDAQEWRTVQSAMPAQLGQIAQAFGTTTAGLREAMNSGEVSMDDFMGKIVELNETGGENFASFEEQARGATGGIATQMANLNTAITRNVANVIDNFNKSGAISNILSTVTDAVNVIGSTVIPMAKTLGEKVSEAVDTLKEAFAPLASELPEDGKAFAEVLGELTKGLASFLNAIAPVLPTLVKVAPLMLTAHAASSTLAGGISAVAKTVQDAQKAFAAFNAAETLGSKLNALGLIAKGPVVAGITAAVAVIGVLAVSFMDAQRKSEDFEKATTGLIEAGHNVADAADDASKGIEKMGSAAANAIPSVSDFTSQVDELITKQAKLAGEIDDAFSESNTKSETLQTYAERIAELAGNCNGAEGDLAELAAAVKSYNDIAGTSYEITDAVSGKLNASTKEVLDNADAFKRRNDAAAAQEELVKVNEQIAEVEAKIAEGTKVANAAFSSYGDTVGMNIEIQQDAANATTGTADNMDKLKAALAAAKAKAAELTETIRNGGAPAVEDLGEKSEEAANALKDAATAFEKQLDAIYKAQQKAYNTSYKELQRALSRDEKALSKSLDAQYNAVKKSLDKQYDARKKSLDSQYDALKKRLDDELSAVKKADDKTLSQLKKTQSAQVEAFKKATEQRIKLIDDEYNAKLKLLEQDEKRRTDALDAQIAAIEGQSDAEAAARKKAQQEAKIADLKQQTQTNKTYKARQEAAKQLEEYLAEIEQERVEEERKAQIESLENAKQAISDEIDAKKEKLKEDTDTRKDAVKESREKELEAIQEANEREYEKQQEALEAKETALKESHDRQLENLKESNAAKLEALKESHNAQLEAIREANQEQEEALRESHSDQLEAQREANSEALAALKESQAEQLEEFKKSRGALKTEGEGAAVDAQKNSAQAGANIKEELEKATYPVQYAMRKIREKMAEEGIGAATDAEGFGGSAGGKFGDAIGNSSYKTSDGVRKLTDIVKERLNDVRDDAETAGENTTRGFSDGMGNVDIWTAAWNVGQNALNAIKSALGIASPSKEAEELGRFLDEGLERGIDRNARGVVESARSVAEDALGSMNGALSTPGFGIPNAAGTRAASALAGAGIVITGNEFNVREEADINRIAEQLMTKIKREQEARQWKPSFTTA